MAERKAQRDAFAAGAEWANGRPFRNPQGVAIEAERRYPEPKPPKWETCWDCDGCGWTEGGRTLQTTCGGCNGTGRTKIKRSNA